MRIVNNTDWKTEHLRAIASRVARETTARVRKRAVITFDYSRRGKISGCAVISGHDATVRLPSARRCAAKNEPVDRVMLASCIAHELAHLEGVTNERSMRADNSWFGFGSGAREHFAWAADMPLEAKAQRGRPKLTPIERAKRERDRARENLSRWESRKRRTETTIQKYRKRVRYYEARLNALRRALISQSTQQQQQKEIDNDDDTERRAAAAGSRTASSALAS